MKTNFFLLVATFCLVIACNKVKPPDISYDTGFEQIVDYKFILNANCDTAIIPELPEINQGYIVHEDATNVKFASFNPNNSNEIVFCRKSNGATKEINVYDRQTHTSRLLTSMQIISPPKWGNNGWILLNAGNIYKIKGNGDSLEVIAKGYSSEWNYDGSKFAYDVLNGNTKHYIGVVQDFATGKKDTLPFTLDSHISWQNQDNQMVFYTSDQNSKGINIVDMNKVEKKKIFEIPDQSTLTCWINNNEFAFVISDTSLNRYQLKICNIKTSTITAIAEFCLYDSAVFLSYSPSSNELLTIVSHVSSLGGIHLSITARLMVLNLNDYSVNYIDP